MKTYFTQTWLTSWQVGLMLVVGWLIWPLNVAAQRLAFRDAPDPKPYLFHYSSPQGEYLTKLRTLCALDKVVAGQTTDQGRVRAVCAWTHNLWWHDGSSTSKQADPISILRQVEQGASFQCVEYAIVLAGALTSLGMPARPLYLKASKAPTKQGQLANGHALTEVWLRDERRWIVADAQWNAVPLLVGQPLNAVELQQALDKGGVGALRLAGRISRARTLKYFRWLRPYLYYFDTPLDNRYDVARPLTTRLLLLPVEGRQPPANQGSQPLKNLCFTHSLASFYPAPPALQEPEGPQQVGPSAGQVKSSVQRKPPSALR